MARPSGYAFYVIEEHKGLLGGLYVSPRYPQLALAQKLLASTLETLRAIPRIERIEAQLVPFGCAFRQALASRVSGCIRGNSCCSISRTAGGCRSRRNATRTAPRRLPGWSLERWDDRYFAPCARLIQLAYANHMDGEINDQYRSESGALKFLKNIIILPGCGQFQAHASFVLRAPHSHELAGRGADFGSGSRRGHTTQICVMPGYQGHGLGRRLIEAHHRGAARAALHGAFAHGHFGQSARRCDLYENIGFPADQDVHGGGVAAGRSRLTRLRLLPGAVAQQALQLGP